MSHYFIYGKDDCKYCKMAVLLLTEEDRSFTVFKLGEHFTKNELLEKFPSATTFPQIVEVSDLGETYIGGYKELSLYVNLSE
jgi:glutaredoxin